jgi:GNAT superfamily N-acetyltransferase
VGDDIAVVPATPDRWGDLEALFGPNGAYSNCWCMWWRLVNREHAANGPDGNRAALRDLVEDGREPGLLAYDNGTPVGWVSVAPRVEFGRVFRSPLFRPDDPDDAGCWSVVCFYVPRAHRGRGLTDVLLAGAVEHARAGGGTSIEGYAIVGDDLDTPSLHHGLASTFERAGFTQVAAPSPRRRLMRRTLP